MTKLNVPGMVREGVAKIEADKLVQKSGMSADDINHAAAVVAGAAQAQLDHVKSGAKTQFDTAAWLRVQIQQFEQRVKAEEAQTRAGGNANAPANRRVVSRAQRERADLRLERRHQERMAKQGATTLVGVVDPTRDRLTTRERKAILRERQKEHEADVKRRDELVSEHLDKLPAAKKELMRTHQQKVEQLQFQWRAFTNVQHEQRRSMRVQYFRQLICYASDQFFPLAAEAFVGGIPRMNRDFQLVPEIDPATDEPRIDAATGQRVVARVTPPGERFYMQFACPPESFVQFAFAFCPRETRFVSLTKLSEQLAKEEETNGTDTDMAVMYRTLVRAVKTYDPAREFVFMLQVQNDAVRPGEEGVMTWGTGVCTHRECDEPQKIAALGPLKQKPCMCGNCGGFIIVPASRHSRCEKDEACTSLVFCSPQCKRAHLTNKHEDSAEARKRAKKAAKKAANKAERAAQTLHAERIKAHQQRDQADREDKGESFGLGDCNLFAADEDEESTAAVADKTRGEEEEEKSVA